MVKIMNRISHFVNRTLSLSHLPLSHGESGWGVSLRTLFLMLFMLVATTSVMAQGVIKRNTTVTKSLTSKPSASKPSAGKPAVNKKSGTSSKARQKSKTVHRSYSNNYEYVYADSVMEDDVIVDTAAADYVYIDDETSTGTYYNEGGKFVKDGTTWQEYRDKQAKVWSTYNQTSADDNYFYLKNTVCEVAVPKTARNDFYLKNDKGEWNVVYRQTGTKYNYKGGYFVRVNSTTWVEYKDTQTKAWAAYDFDSEEDNFYIIQNSQCRVAVPKTTANNFYMVQDGEWKVIYSR